MKTIHVCRYFLAYFATLLLIAPPAEAQSLPKAFTYQGLLETNGAPAPDGTYAFNITLTDPSGTMFTETLPSVAIQGGIFNIVLGEGTPIPSNFSFNGQITISVSINGSAIPLSSTASKIWSAPYAINSLMLDGIDASLVPVSGKLFPVPIGTGYTGTAKLDPAFLPNSIPNRLLATQDITTIDTVAPAMGGNFNILAGSGITIAKNTNGITISNSGSGGLTGVFGTPGSPITGGGSTGNVFLTIAPGSITGTMLQPGLQLGTSSTTATVLTAVDSETNGNKALLIRGGIGANNPTGTSDGSGLNPTNPQTYWADQISVPTLTGMTLNIYNTLVSSTSTIVVTPFALNPAVGDIAITSQSDGTFTVSSSANMGTGNGGVVTGINYMIVNH